MTDRVVVLLMANHLQSMIFYIQIITNKLSCIHLIRAGGAVVNVHV